MAKKIRTELIVKDSGSKTVKKFSQTTTSAFRKIAGAAGVGALGVAFTSLAKKTLDYGDQLHKLNLRLGVSVTELDKLRKIGELSGVQFNTLSIALQRMQRRVQDASSGMGPAAKALERLGLEAGKLSKLRTDEQFMAIAKALSNVESQAERVSLAFSLFDSDGVRLLQMVDDIERKMKKMNSQWGPEKTEQVAKFNDNITTMKERLSDMAVVIVNSLVPAWEKLIKFWQGGADNLQEGVTDRIIQLRRQIEFLKKSISSREEKKEGALGFLISDEQLDESRRKLFLLEEQLKGMVDFGKRVDEDRKAKTPRKTLDPYVRSFEGLEKIKVKPDKAALESNTKTVMALTDLWATFNNEQVQKASEASAQKWAAIEEMEKEAAEKSKKILKEKDRMIEASAQFFGDRFSDAFMDFANGAKNASDAFRDMTISILNDMARILAQQAFMSIFKGLFSMGGGTAGTGFASIFGLAGGGTAQAGKPYVVGEQGPELFIPGRTGQVIPNGAGGGINSVVTVNVDAGENSGIDNQNADKMGRMISQAVNEQVKKTLIQETRHGGMLNQRQTAMKGV